MMINKTTSLALLFLSASLSSYAQLRVIDESAIAYTGFLSKAEFDQRFPGETLQDSTQVAPGWYVIYEHQALNYYFGPITLESTGRDYLAQLRTIVGEAVGQRPSIQDYSLELKQAPFESAQSSSAESNPDASAAEESTESGEDSSAAGQPESSSFNIWSLVKGLFGF